MSPPNLLQGFSLEGQGAEDKIGLILFIRGGPGVGGWEARPPQRAMWMWAAAPGEGGRPFLPLSVSLLAKYSCPVRHQGAYRLMKPKELSVCIFP